MPTVTCPLCQTANPAAAVCCAVCGVGLVAQCPRCDTVNERLAPACRACGAALLVDSAAAPAAPAPGAPTGLAISLIEPRAIDSPLETPGARRGAADTSWPDIEGHPRANGLELWADPFATTAAPTPSTAAPGGATPTGPERRAAPTPKALAQQAARRARMAQAAASLGTRPVPRDVLVLEGNDGTRDQLCDLLDHFGFRVHAASTLAQAGHLVQTRPFAAAFLDIVLDGADAGAGIELCYQIKQGGKQGGGAATAVVVLSAQSRPADRVLAALARSDIYLAKPVSRGAVARALESCGVRLPADPRRG